LNNPNRLEDVSPFKRNSEYTVEVPSKVIDEEILGNTIRHTGELITL